MHVSTTLGPGAGPSLGRFNSRRAQSLGTFFICYYFFQTRWSGKFCIPNIVRSPKRDENKKTFCLGTIFRLRWLAPLDVAPHIEGPILAFSQLCPSSQGQASQEWKGSSTWRQVPFNKDCVQRVAICRTVEVGKINTYASEARSIEKRRDVSYTSGWNVPYWGVGLLNSTSNEMPLLSWK